MLGTSERRAWLGWRRNPRRGSSRSYRPGVSIANSPRFFGRGPHDRPMRSLTGGTDMTIRHVIAAAACALGLAACSSSNADLWVPSWTAFGVKPTTVSVTIESEPAGAEARTTQGLTCLTPCTLSVPPSEEFSISYTLAGYVPQSVSVRPVEPEPSKFGPPPVPGLTPNPVMAQLKPVADVAVPAQRKKKQRPRPRPRPRRQRRGYHAPQPLRRRHHPMRRRRRP